MKKPTKTIIVKVPKVKPFDLTLSDNTENIRIVTALESLKCNQGWQFMTQLFQKNLETLANSIITKTDYDGSPISEVEVDILRFKYNYINELSSKPDMFLKKLKTYDNKEESLDPYDI